MRLINPLNTNIAVDGHKIRKFQTTANRKWAVGFIGNHFHKVVQHGGRIQRNILKTARHTGNFQNVLLAHLIQNGLKIKAATNPQSAERCKITGNRVKGHELKRLSQSRCKSAEDYLQSSI